MKEHRIVGVLAFALIAVCIAGIANAATSTLAFTRPSTYSDGSTLPSSAITGYVVTCTFTPTGGTASACTGLTGSPLAGGTNQAGSITFTAPAAGGQACVKLFTQTATAADPVGSSPACTTVADTRTPGSPTNVTVTVTVALQISSDTPIRVAVSEPVVTRK
jgi:hypothetical protein